MKHFSVAVALMATLVACAAHAQHYGGRDYSTNETGRLQSARLGVVEDVREVELHEQPNPYAYRPTVTQADACGVVGAVAGAAVGNHIGKGNGRVVATVAGVLLGAGAAREACKPARPRGVEITVKLDDGKAIVLVQALDEEFLPGDRVRLIEGAKARLTRIGFRSAREETRFTQ